MSSEGLAPVAGAGRSEPRLAPSLESADESVARRFSRLMNATTSRFGVLTDPPLVALATGIGLVAMLAALRLDAGAGAVRALAVAAALPIAVACAVSIALLGARRRVVEWLASLPFPVENMNALLNGVGEQLEVRFAATMPTAPELNAELDRVHPDSFVTSGDEAQRTIEVRIGVVDSKRNPARTNFLRYERVRLLVDRVLVPLGERHPIVEVRIK